MSMAPCRDLVLLLAAVLLLGGLHRGTGADTANATGSPAAAPCPRAGDEAPCGSRLQLLVVLPLHAETFKNRTDGGVAEASRLPAWDRGLEILPGALVAAERVNAADDLLRGVTLEVVAVNASLCGRPTGSESSTLVAFVREALGRRRARDGWVAGVAGLFCDKSAALISSVATTTHIHLLQLSGSASPALEVEAGGRNSSVGSPLLHRMVPPSRTYCDVVLALMGELGWERIAIIGEIFSSYYTSTADECLEQFSAWANVTFFAPVSSHDHSVSETISSLRASGSRVALISTGAGLAAKILCEAIKEDMLWSEYAWLTYDHTPSDLLAHPTPCSAEKLRAVLDEVVMLRYELTAEPSCLRKEPETKRWRDVDYHDSLVELESQNGLLRGTLQRNEYANVLYDSVLAFALAFNSSGPLLCNSSASQRTTVEDANCRLREVQFQGASRFVDFTRQQVSTPVTVYHRSNVVIASYRDGILSAVNYSYLGSQTIPTDEIPRRYSLLTVPITIILSVIISSFLIVSVPMLVLFLAFRAEPEIKATSPLLSLNLYFGSYLLFACALTNTVSSAVVNGGGAREVVCSAVAWTGALGINFIFATLIVRMFRIYYIFHHFGKIGHLWSDWTMFGFIMAVVGANAFLLLLWSTLDPYLIVDYETYVPEGRPPYYSVVQYCYSEYTQIWLVLVFGEIGVLSIAVVIMAIKTRKIKRSDFKDTKKVSAYVLLVIVAMCLLLPLWWTLRLAENAIAGNIIIYLGYGTTAVLCQLFLFAPKVVPPLRRRICGGAPPTFDTSINTSRAMPAATNHLYRQHSNSLTASLPL